MSSTISSGRSRSSTSRSILDASQLKAFEAINKILTQKKDWKQLERAFRKMLHRVVGQGNTELEFNLWHNLGVIYRDRQRKYDSAAEAFRMASQLQPDNKVEHQILAELFAMIPEKLGDAIAEHQWMLRQDPYQVDSYRALFTGFTSMHARVRQGLVSRVDSELPKES